MILSMLAGLGDEIAVEPVARHVASVIYPEPVRIEGRHPLFWQNNQHVLYGAKGAGPKERFVRLSPLITEHHRLGNLAVSYAVQVGLGLLPDTQPRIYLTQEEIEKGFKLLENGNLKAYRGVVTFDPWAGWRSRRWPLVNFIGLVDRLRKAGFFTVEIGTNRPDDFGAIYVPTLPVDRQLFGKTDTRLVAAVLSHADLHVGNDNGMMHMAAAVDTPQLAFFSSTPWYARAYPNTVPVLPDGGCDHKCLMNAFCQRKELCLESVSVDHAFAKAIHALGRFGRKSK